MQLENAAHDLKRIAKAFRLISKEISPGGLRNALLGVAIENFGAVRVSVLLSEELLAKTNASFPREKAQRRAYSRCTTWRNATPQTQRVRPISERRPSPDAYAGAEFCHTIMRRSVCDAAPAGPESHCARRRR